MNDYYRHKRYNRTEYPDNWAELRETVLNRDGRRCCNCGDPQASYVHHVVPLGVGGSNELTNLITICNGCHKRIHPHMRFLR